MTYPASRAFSIYRHPAGDFPTLPAPFQRESITQALDRCAKSLAIPASVIRTFRLMLSKTRPSDFTDPTREPCCFTAQAELATELGLTPRQIRSHERILCRLGLIEKRTMANGARSGFLGCGIYFSAAISLFPTLQAMVDRAEADRRQRATLRGLRSVHLRHVKSALTELTINQSDDPSMMGFIADFQTWPSAAKLHTMALQDLAAHEHAARELAVKLTEYIEKGTISSGRTEADFRPFIQDTTRDSILSCSGRVAVPSDTTCRTNVVPATSAHCAEKNIESPEPARNNRFIQNLTPERLYRLCPADLRQQLDIIRGNRATYTVHDFDCVVQAMLPLYGITASAYGAAVETMGPQTTTMCLIITYAKAQDPACCVRNPGGYLRGMTRAFVAGQLNIMASLIGMSEKHIAEHCQYAGSAPMKSLKDRA